tara:strand:+ start:8364 stop:8654 length:291 start_codon:yes stop_codon:yes gene_type:complete
VVRTHGFHPCNRGSIPLRAAKFPHYKTYYDIILLKKDRPVGFLLFFIKNIIKFDSQYELVGAGVYLFAIIINIISRLVSVTIKHLSPAFFYYQEIF